MLTLLPRLTMDPWTLVIMIGGIIGAMTRNRRARIAVIICLTAVTAGKIFDLLP
ncbi:hypothetical protein SAMN04515660_0163 [Luteibacter sp. 329MFSha]|nr:hypothetical protein SAMN04515660_0163 [Luteibacter sp. 329MFSha]